MFMTPELRFGLYRLDPQELGFQYVRARMCGWLQAKQTRICMQYEEQLRSQQEGKSGSEPDDGIVQNLMKLGISENGSKRACLAVKNAGLDQAMEWAFEHSDDPIFNEPVKSKKKKARLIPLELQRLFAQLQHLERKTISTHDLTTRGFQWQGLDGRVQHDAHELNRWNEAIVLSQHLTFVSHNRLLIDALERSLAKTSGQELVKSLYNGVSVNQTRCLGCGNVSEREESFYDLMVQVECAL
jgi:hypothetical protein